jgi:ABC-type transport system substrate-binding protein
MVQNITKAEAVDKYTVKVTLSAPNSSLFAGVSENRTVLMPKEMDDIGFSDPMKLGGMGPYQISEFKRTNPRRSSASTATSAPANRRSTARCYKPYPTGRP